MSNSKRTFKPINTIFRIDLIAWFMLIAFAIMGLILGYQFADSGFICREMPSTCEWGLSSYLWSTVCILTGIFVSAVLLALSRIIELLETE